MKNILYVLIVLLVVSVSVSAQFYPLAKGHAESHDRRARQAYVNNVADYKSDTTVDVTYYKLNLVIDPEMQYLRGETTISFKSQREALASFYLDLSDTLKVDSILLGNSRLNFVHNDNLLKITLDKNYSLNALITVNVYYQGKPEKNQSFSFDVHGEGTEQFPIVATSSQPFGTKDWFPSKNSPGDKADSSEVWITAPCPFVSVSNGNLIKIIENTGAGGCSKTYQWKSTYPISSYLISIASSNYKQYNIYYKYTEKDSMIITNFVYPENWNPQTKDRIDSTLIFMDFLSRKLGPYPFLKEKYGHAQYNGDGGMEHQTCSSVLDFPTNLIMHELAHQWFGDKITNKGWEHIWLHEGFANYSEFLLFEMSAGKDQLNRGLADFSNEHKDFPIGSIFVRDPTKASEIINIERSYFKASLVIHMLRNLVGDDVFYKILQAYMSSDLAYGVATTEDFQAVAEKVSGKELDYFFDQWIYGENYPKYSYQWSYTGNQKNGFIIKLKLDQEKNTSPSFFTMPIQITSKSIRNSDEIRTILNNAASQEFLIPVTEEPKELVFDSGYNVMIKTIVKGEFVLSPILGLEETADHIIKISPNPALNEFSVELNPNKSGMVKLELLNSSGQITRTLIDDKLPAGKFQRRFLLKALPAGTYFLRLNQGGTLSAKKLVIF